MRPDASGGESGRALPRERFAAVGSTTDPVAVRTLLRDGQRYFYLVNRDYYPVAVEVAFDRSPGRVRDLAAGQEATASRRLQVVLGPYELRSFGCSPKARVTGFKAQPPAEIANALLADGRAALSELAALRAAGKFVPGAEQVERGIAAAIAQGRLAWLRRALTSYAVRKCRALANAGG